MNVYIHSVQVQTVRNVMEKIDHAKDRKISRTG